MDNALTAVEKEVYNLSLKIAQLETPDEFARTRAKLEVSAEFVNVNFATSDRTKALDASIGTLLRTLTVLEAKNLKNVQGSSRLERPNQYSAPVHQQQDARGYHDRRANESFPSNDFSGAQSSDGQGYYGPEAANASWERQREGYSDRRRSPSPPRYMAPQGGSAGPQHHEPYHRSDPDPDVEGLFALLRSGSNRADASLTASREEQIPDSSSRSSHQSRSMRERGYDSRVDVDYRSGMTEDRPLPADERFGRDDFGRHEERQGHQWSSSDRIHSDSYNYEAGRSRDHSAGRSSYEQRPRSRSPHVDRSYNDAERHSGYHDSWYSRSSYDTPDSHDARSSWSDSRGTYSHGRPHEMSSRRSESYSYDDPNGTHPYERRDETWRRESDFQGGFRRHGEEMRQPASSEERNRIPGLSDPYGNRSHAREPPSAAAPLFPIMDSAQPRSSYAGRHEDQRSQRTSETLKPALKRPSQDWPKMDPKRSMRQEDRDPPPLSDEDKIENELCSEEATRTIVFSNLDQSVTDTSLRAVAGKYGIIEHLDFYKWPNVKYHGARITYESLKSAVTAKVKLHNMKFRGVKALVSYGSLFKEKVLWVEDVPRGITVEELTSKFRVCGRVHWALTDDHRRQALVFYNQEETALRALSYMRMNKRHAAGMKVDVCRPSDRKRFNVPAQGEEDPKQRAQSSQEASQRSSLDSRLAAFAAGSVPPAVSTPQNKPQQPLASAERSANVAVVPLEEDAFSNGLNPELDLIIEDIPVGPDDDRVLPALKDHFSKYSPNVFVCIYGSTPTNAFRFAVVHFDTDEYPDLEDHCRSDLYSDTCYMIEDRPHFVTPDARNSNLASYGGQ